ncbi:MAG TPA: DegV family protein [Acidimicrobiales bacterium]|nr:DegV family protein [Acidimicrobiales bacterium]
MIGLVTDSNAMLPPDLAARYDVEVVPLTVTVDGVDYQEGVDLDADAFYGRFQSGRPVVSTAQPSPGRFAAAYEAVAERGATEILSVHIGSSVSGTINSARLASQVSPVPVRIVDSGTASFAISLCLWEAAEAVAAGAGAEEAAAAAERVGATVGNVFVVGALDLARSGGRLGSSSEPAGPGAIPVLIMVGGTMRVVQRTVDLDHAADVMAGVVRAGGTSLRVGVGLSDATTLALVVALEDRLRDAAEVRELVRYRIGPSVGAHTGPGTVGTMFAPTSLR